MKKILIIEDERPLANMIKKYLVNEKYQVEVAADGNEGMRIFGIFQPDLLILDLMLPGKDGLEILGEVRLKSGIPVIITSAKETEFDRVLGLKLGADDYLAKPFSLKELVARVAALFRRIDHYQRKISEVPILKYQSYHIDVTAREVTEGHRLIQLTAKEFDLLIFLLKHPKQVLSKEQIYQQVWGEQEFGELHTVTIHIQKIREKMGINHEITTIRSVGYRFDGALL